jgi:hypothetical protein
MSSPMRVASAALTLILASSAATPSPAVARVVAPFPDGFLWGAAISGFQSDMGLGAPDDEGTDWWVWVHDQDNGGR